MTGRWIDAVAVVEAADAEVFERVMERHASGLDATYRTEEYLGVELPTGDDEVMFRLYLLGDHTIDDIHRVADLLYLVSSRLSDDVRRCIEQGAFEAAAVPFTALGLELRDEGVLRRLQGALDAERPSFAGGPPVLYPA